MNWDYLTDLIITTTKKNSQSLVVNAKNQPLLLILKGSSDAQGSVVQEEDKANQLLNRNPANKCEQKNTVLSTERRFNQWIALSTVQTTGACCLKDHLT